MLLCVGFFESFEPGALALARGRRQVGQIGQRAASAACLSPLLVLPRPAQFAL